MHWFVFFPEKQHTKVEAFMDLIPETDLNLKTRNQVKKILYIFKLIQILVEQIIFFLHVTNDEERK